MKIYLAGPMRGLPAFNFPAFMAAAEELRAAGHEVFNPAEKSIEAMGFDPSKRSPTAGSEAEAGVDIRDLLVEDLIFICKDAEAIVLLPGAWSSSGAAAETATAKALTGSKRGNCQIFEFAHDAHREALGLKPLYLFNQKVPVQKVVGPFVLEIDDGLTAAEINDIIRIFNSHELNQNEGDAGSVILLKKGLAPHLKVTPSGILRS
jgi:Domain of unknown function (DUF4406)